MAGSERQAWVMPDWMEPYQRLFQNTGGYTVTELMNLDPEAPNNVRNNPVLATMYLSVAAQVDLLRRLHHHGHLKEGSDGVEAEAPSQAMPGEALLPGPG